MKKILASMSLAVALAAAAPAVFAGQKASVPVFVDLKNRVAGGALGSARNSTDLNQKLGCGVYADAGFGAYASCAAITATGTMANCYSTNADIVKAAQALGTDAHLIFYWDASGQCTTLQTLNDSSTEPKKP